jgi:hypothetical protein
LLRRALQSTLYCNLRLENLFEIRDSETFVLMKKEQFESGFPIKRLLENEKTFVFAVCAEFIDDRSEELL